MTKVIGLAFALVLAIAGTAHAYVTVNPSEVAEGSFAKLTFRVPNESDTASTTGLEIAFPEAATFGSVSVKPTPGWEATVAREGETVTGITWEGGEIAPGEFQEFDISVGPVPEVDVLEFKAVQTYSDGEVVRWIDPVIEGEEAEHPAPTATVVEGSGDEHGGGGEAEEAEDGDEAAAPADADDDDGDDGIEPIEFATLLLVGGAMVAAVAALIFARRRPPA